MESRRRLRLHRFRSSSSSDNGVDGVKSIKRTFPSSVPPLQPGESPLLRAIFFQHHDFFLAPSRPSVLFTSQPCRSALRPDYIDHVMVLRWPREVSVREYIDKNSYVRTSEDTLQIVPLQYGCRNRTLLYQRALL